MFVRRPRHAALLAGLLVCSLAGACGGEGLPASVELQLADGARTLTREQLADLPELSVSYKDRNYTGVRLRDLLAAQGQELTPLVATAVDGYSQELSVEAVARDDAMLAYAVDGGHLTAADGPLRLVVPASPGLSVKRLVRLARP
jgi:DMSO/TMAO reductase YedYZ molybdopterin-dependent catalytic subunit